MDKKIKELDKVAADLWNICMKTAIEGINNELPDSVFEKKVKKFTARLRRFQNDTIKNINKQKQNENCN